MLPNQSLDSFFQFRHFIAGGCVQQMYAEVFAFFVNTGSARKETDNPGKQAGGRHWQANGFRNNFGAQSGLALKRPPRDIESTAKGLPEKPW